MAKRHAEMVLDAFLLALQVAAPTRSTVLRNEPLPLGIPATGTMILYDGDPGPAETTLSPATYHYQHVAEVEIAVQGATAAKRDAALDVLVQAVGAATSADRTLGGLCDWVEGEAPAPAEVPVEGASTIKAATVRVVLHYATSDPLA